MIFSADARKYRWLFLAFCCSTLAIWSFGVWRLKERGNFSEKKMEKIELGYDWR
jgi:hypothetical protein